MLRYFFLSVNCEIIIQRNDTMIELYAMYNTVWNRERRFLSVWMEISLLIISRLVSNKAHTHTHTWHKASVGWICVMGWGPYEASFQLISFTTSRKRVRYSNSLEYDFFLSLLLLLLSAYYPDQCFVCYKAGIRRKRMNLSMSRSLNSTTKLNDDKHTLTALTHIAFE